MLSICQVASVIFVYSIDGHDITIVHEKTDFGVLIDHHLSSKPHVDNEVAETYSMLGLL